MAAASAAMTDRKRRDALPGFGVTLGFTLTYLGLVVLFPLTTLALRAGGLGFTGFLNVISEPRAIAALKLSFGLALAAAVLNAVAGTIIAWVLTRYRFPGRQLLDAIVDLPFALPTAVAGLALTALYAPNGWLGAGLAQLGIKVAFTPLGIFIALVFIGVPFVVRTVQPVILELQADVEEAAATLGASRLRTLWTVLLPTLAPAILTGFGLAFSRGVGEYGSVIFIAGNIPKVSEIAPLLITIRLEEFQYESATAIALVMLLLSFVVLFAINLVQGYGRRRLGHV